MLYSSPVTERLHGCSVKWLHEAGLRAIRVDPACSLCLSRSTAKICATPNAKTVDFCTYLHLFAPICGKTPQNKNFPANRKNRKNEKLLRDLRASAVKFPLPRSALRVDRFVTPIN